MVWTKKTFIYLAILLMPLTLLNCKNQAKKANADKEQVQLADQSKVKIYYFHGKQRCKTCVAIQQVAEEAFKNNFGENAEVAFMEVDFSDKANAALADKYEVSFSSLIVATATEHTDLTELAFYNVMSNPDLLKQALVENTNNYLQ